jgi:hypothetical protein
MEVMKLNESSSAVALVAFLLVPYPLMYAASLLACPRGVQVALAFLGLVVLSGTKLAMVVIGRRRSGPPR